MTSSSEDDPEDKVVTLLQQIKGGLEAGAADESAEERAARLEKILSRVADVLTLYGANIFALAVYQVQIIKQLTDIEDLMAEKSVSKMPLLPHFRQRGDRNDADN